MNELKNCPMCGCEAELEEDSKGAVVQCTNYFHCGITTGDDSDTAAAALNKWNTRTAPEGMVLVPIEPTVHMQYAAESTDLTKFCTSSRQSRHHDIADQVYRAMIKAAQEG